MCVDRDDGPADGGAIRHSASIQHLQRWASQYHHVHDRVSTDHFTSGWRFYTCGVALELDTDHTRQTPALLPIVRYAFSRVLESVVIL